jgi:hypothetical protein
MMPPDLVIFMRWIGLLEVAAHAAPRPHMGGVWFKDGEVPF